MNENCNAAEIASLQTEVRLLTQQVHELTVVVHDLERLANKGRGAILVLIALGGLLGWLTKLVWEHTGAGQ